MFTEIRMTDNVRAYYST